MSKIKKYSLAALSTIGGVAVALASHAALVTLPDASTTYNGMSDYCSTTFTQFQLFIYVVLGVIVGSLAINWLVSVVASGAKKILRRKKGGSRRRR